MVDEIVKFLWYLWDIPRTCTIFCFTCSIIYLSFVIFTKLRKKVSEETALWYICIFFGIIALITDYILWIYKP